MKRSHCQWSGRDETILLRMRRTGCSWEDIGRAVGRKAKTVEWYAYNRMGLMGRRRFEKLKTGLKPDASNGTRPTFGQFEIAAMFGADNRGWGKFLDCRTVKGSCA